MSRIKDGEAPMFSTRTRGHDPHTIVFADESAPKNEREIGIEISAGWSTVDEDVKLVMIDTDSTTGRIRIELNDATLFDGNPEEPRTMLSTYDILNLAHDARFRGLDTTELARRIDSGEINTTTIKED